MSGNGVLRARTSLNGSWSFRLDPKERGMAEKWYERPDSFDAAIRVPGTIQSQQAGYAARYDARRTRTAHESFSDLDPDIPITRSEYRGTAWYARQFTAPAFGGGDAVWLCLDAVHPSAVVWIDGERAGEHRTGPLERCRINVTALVAPGKSHRLTVMVTEDGRLLQGVVKWPYFSGIYKDAYLEITKRAWIEDIAVRPDIATGAVGVTVTTGGDMRGGFVSCEITDRAGAQAAECGAPCPPEPAECTLPLAVPGHRLWDTDSPYLYTCAVRLAIDGAPADEMRVRFGFRSFSRNGRQLLLNGRPLFLRGTGFGGAPGFPDPGPDAAGWYRRIVERVKEYGFNYLRWHTYSMEQPLLDAADELGLLIQSELFSVFYETEEERAVTAAQCELMLRRNRNHPSVACFVMGNEHDGTNPRFISLRDSLCDMARRMSPDTLVMDSDGISPDSVASHPRSDVACAGIGAGIGNVLDMSPVIADMVDKNTKPFMIHEFGYPESFPRVGDIPKYTSGLRPFWLEHAAKSAKESGMEGMLGDFTEKSRRLHFRIVKKAIEDARKVEGLAGYGHWGFHDFVHESIGLVDLFLEDKGGSAPEFRQANGEIALSVTPVCDRFTCHEDEPFEFDLHLSNHSGKPLYDCALEWELSAGGETVDAGNRRISAGEFGAARLGRFAVKGPETGKPYAASLRARIGDAGAANEWNVWFFPRLRRPSYGARILLFKDGWQTMMRLRSFCPDFAGVTEAALWDAPPDALLITPLITDAVADFLIRGGRVLLMPTYYVNGNPGLPMLPSSFGPMPSFAGTVGGCGTLVGRHPVLEGFPHEGWCDYQWFDLIGGERIPHVCAPFHMTTPKVFDLGKWPVSIEPIVRSIPNWKACNNRAYLFEAGVGQGRLLASSMRIFETVFTNPESAWLLDSMLRYAAGGGFAPGACVTAEEFERVRVPVELINL